MSQMSGLDLNQFYRKVFRQIQRIPSVQQSALMGYISLALSYRPPLFSGETDFIALEEWQAKMGYIFHQIGCPEDRKIEVAVRFLVGPALQWWRSVELRVMSNESSWSWSKFIEELRSRFLVEFHYPRRSEFISLKQGCDMSVTDYLQKFMELMHHAPDVIFEEKYKVQRFIEGLSPKIRICCVSMRRATWSEVVEHALMVEQGIKEEQQRLQKQDKNQGKQRDKKKRMEQGESSQANTTQGPSPKQAKRDKATVVCWYCGECGHYRHECERLKIKREELRKL